MSESGYWAARFLDTSIAGSIASAGGILFLLTLLLAPGGGLLVKRIGKIAQKLDFANKLLLIHVYNHENTAVEKQNNTKGNIHKVLKWDKKYCEKILSHAKNREFIDFNNNLIKLTEKGREIAKKSLEQH
jgi:manganese/zinc/iron transport system permease protein